MSRASSKKAEEGLAGCFFALVYCLVTVPLMSVLYGWTLATLWAWFMVSTFGLPHIGVAQAIGLSIVVRVITYQADASNDNDERSIYESLITSTLKGVLLCGFSLITGAIVFHFTK